MLLERQYFNIKSFKVEATPLYGKIRNVAYKRKKNYKMEGLRMISMFC